MAEQWIDAAQALEIAGDPISLCTRLSAGLITARARTLTMDGQEAHNVSVPKTFWWAKGYEALEQDWSSGDFFTWIERKSQVSAFGVQFPLSAVLEMLAFEKRAIVARSLSVSGSADWLSALQARQLAYNEFRFNPMTAGSAIIEQARLGFVSARAVLAQGSFVGHTESNWSWEEREWNIPIWYWTEFTGADKSSQNWDLGRFSGRGAAPDRTRWITLSGVHFHRASLFCLDPAKAKVEPPEANRGRKAKYDWAAATSNVATRLLCGELIPKAQADVERAFITALTKGDEGPNEASVRPYAKQLYEGYLKSG
jgi:hypothetical protein